VKGAQVKGAFWAMVAFYVVYSLRPEDWIPALRLIHLAKITGGLAVLAAVLTLGTGRSRFPREILYLVLLIAQFWLAVPFSPVWRGGAFWATLDFSKLILVLPVMVLVIGTLGGLRQFIFVQAGSAALVALASVVAFRGATERMSGAEGAQYGNPNDLAMSLAIALPFCFAFLLRGRGFLRKMVWALSILVMGYAVFLTESRSGLLAVVMSMGACLWEFGVRGGRRYLVVLAGVAVMVLAIVAGKGLEGRFAATFGQDISTKEGRTAYDSAMERREMLKDSIILTLEHPLFGVGAGNFTPTTQSWKETHNNYTQVSCEGGIPALIFFLMFLGCGFSNLRETRKRAPKGSEEALWVGALNASLLGFLVGSFFASIAYLFFPYFLVAYTSVLRSVVSSTEIPSPEPAPQKPRVNGDLFRLGRASSL